MVRRTPKFSKREMSKARKFGGEYDPITGLLMDGDRTVATIRNGEVFAQSAGEKVGYIRKGILYSMAGECLASMDALGSTGEALSARVQKLLKL
jgi:hypothetical protein